MPDSGLASSNSSEAPNAISGPESAVVAGNSPLSYKNAYSSTLGRGILNELARVDGLDRAARLPRIACLPLIAFMDDPSTIRILAVWVWPFVTFGVPSDRPSCCEKARSLRLAM